MLLIGQYLSIGNEVQLFWCVGKGREVRRGLATLFIDIVVCLCVGERGRGRVRRGRVRRGVYRKRGGWRIEKWRIGGRREAR